MTTALLILAASGWLATIGIFAVLRHFMQQNEALYLRSERYRGERDGFRDRCREVESRRSRMMWN